MTLHVASGLRITLDGEVLWATIDRAQTRNAINLDVIAGLEAAVVTAQTRQVKVMVLRGAGGTFCSGADLNDVRRLADDLPGLRSFMGRLGAVLEQLEHAPWVTLAVVEGYAVAGGCELLLVCDIVVAANNARIGDHHVAYGLAPAAGASVRLPRVVSPAVARYLLLTGELLSGTEAAERGLATVAVEPSRLDAEVERIVGRLTSRGRGALRTIKAMLGEDQAADAKGRLQRELDLFLAHVESSNDVRVGLDAFHDGATPLFDVAARR